MKDRLVHTQSSGTDVPLPLPVKLKPVGLGRVLMNRLKNAVYKCIPPAARRSMGTVTHFEMTEPVAALTFDDGPDPEYTPRLLDILAEYKVRATFFMLGKPAERHPRLVRRVAEAGHTIGNHSWDHASFTAIRGKQRRQQIRACEQAVAPYGQRIFRPPWGNQSVASRLDAFYLGYEVVGWNVEVGDWWDQDSQRMTISLMNTVRPGAIVLLHDALYSVPPADEGTTLQADRGPMLRALRLFLNGLAQTYRFVTIPEMFQRGRPIRQNWFQVPRIPG